MDHLISLLNRVFDQKFPGSIHPVNPVLPDSLRMGGYIVWDGFEEQSHIQRQAEVWGAIRDNIDVRDQQRITSILAVTLPEEQAIMENE